jgi:ABC-2 type transport system permease protein
MSSSSILVSTRFSSKEWSYSESRRPAVTEGEALLERLAKVIFDFLAKGACIAKKDAQVYYFKPQIFGFGILIPAFVYLAFSLGREIPPDLLVPGLVSMVSLFGASSVEAISIAMEKQTETYELLQTAPVSTAGIVFGKSLAGSAFGIVLSLCTALGAVLISPSQMVNPIMFVTGIVLGSFAFSALGILVAAAARDMPTANISLTALRLPMIFIGGVFIPVGTLAPGLRLIAYLTPLTYMVDALREAMAGPSVALAVDLAVLAGWFVILEALAVVVLNRRTQL